MKKRMILPLAVAVLIVGSAVAVFGQNKVDPEKLSLIKEFLNVTDATKGVTDMSGLMLDMQAAETAKMVNTLIDADPSLSPEAKEELKKATAETSERSNKRIRDFFTTRLKLEEILIEVAIPVYDKYFTPDELRGLIAFYKTPIGKRMTEVAPQLGIEMMSGMMQKMMPKLEEFIKEAAESELKILKGSKPVT